MKETKKNVSQEETTIENKIREKELFYKNNKFDNKILIVGTGAFGTALGTILLKRNNNVILYGIDKKEIEDINKNHRNSNYFSNLLPENLVATLDIEKSLEDVEIIILAIPSKVFELTLKEVILPNLKKPTYFVNVAKGIDNLNIDLLSNLIKKIIPKELNNGVLKLTGPSFAKEVVSQEPTSFVLASENIETVNKVIDHFKTDTTNIIPSDNLKGAELVSIIKNPLAILLGIVKGLGYGFNARSRIFVDALLEMEKILDYYNLDKNILLSHAGLGDLYLTGTSKKSRNFSTGFQIGKMNKVNKKILSSFITIEGLRSIETIASIARKNNLELKLFDLLYDIAYKNIEPKLAVSNYFKNVY